MGLPKRESRPAGETTEPAQSISTATKTESTIRQPADILADIDALAEHLRGHLVIQVAVDDEGHLRTYLYRSAGAAEKCVLRAKGRGRMAHVSLAQLYPVGVIVGLGDSR